MSSGVACRLTGLVVEAAFCACVGREIGMEEWEKEARVRREGDTEVNLELRAE